MLDEPAADPGHPALRAPVSRWEPHPQGATQGVEAGEGLSCLGQECAAPEPFSRLAGALDVSRCPQSHKNLLFAKAREAFGSMRTTTAAYYHSMRPYLGEPSPLPYSALSPRSPRPSPYPCPLGGAPVEELQHLAQANVSMDIDTFTNLNPSVLQVGGAVQGREGLVCRPLCAAALPPHRVSASAT